MCYFAFFNDFFEANFLTKEQAETIDLLVFFVARVPRCDLSLLQGIHVFFNNFAPLLIMALLQQVYILVVILTQIWGAPDLSIVQAFLVLARKKNMFVKHQKIKPVQGRTHTRCRPGAATRGLRRRICNLKPLIHRRVTCRVAARRGFPLATQQASREGSSGVSRG